MPDDLAQIAQDILCCQRCELRMSATRPVPGFGDIGAKYFLLGEAPGHEEDENKDRKLFSAPEKMWIYFGLPFVGASGRRLDKLLALAEISLNDCYLSNVCRCLPPKIGKERKTPNKKEIKACVGFLWREIRLVRPTTIITLGATSLGLFTRSGGISTLHGTSFEWELLD